MPPCLLVRQIFCFSFSCLIFLECRKKDKHPNNKIRTMLAWSNDVLRQLDEGHRRLFPIIPTAVYACDLRVIAILRSRTLGNSPSFLSKYLHEQYTYTWECRVGHYLTDCEHYKKSLLGRCVYMLAL